MSSTLVIDTGGEVGLSIARSLKAADPRTQVHVLGTSRRSSVRFSRCVDSFHSIREENAHSGWLKSVVAAIRRTGASTILSGSVRGLRLFTEHRSELEASGAAVSSAPPASSLATALDKRLFDESLRAHGVRTPQTVIYRPSPAFAKEFARLRFPVFVKPHAPGNGHRTFRFDARHQARSFLERFADADWLWLVQEYIAGDDIGCSVFCRHGELLAHTVQTAGEARGGPYRRATDIRFIHDDEVVETARSWLGPLRWSGAAHLDFRRGNDGRLYVIGMTPRLGACQLGSARVGVNFAHLALLDAQGKTFPYPAYREASYRTRGAEASLAQRISDPVPELIRFGQRFARTG